MSILNEKYKLINGVEIPKVGFGTWELAPNDAYNAVLKAIELGYRHIDTAEVYGNEKDVGRAIKDSHIKREEIFVTTKLPAQIKDYKKAKETFYKSLEDLQLDYIDLYLIHAPWPWQEMYKDCQEGNLEVWKLFEELYLQHKIRAIGVSNFNVADLMYLTKNSYIKPMVNQVQYFIGHTSRLLSDYLKENHILLEAYSPIYRGRLLEDEEIKKMAIKYKTGVSQICIKYCLQKETLPLPRSKNFDHIKENAQLDFQISLEDMKYLDSLYIPSNRYY